MASSGSGEFHLAVEQWCVWQAAPNNPPAAAWPGGRILPGTADVALLPLLQRRRLSPLARAALAVAWECGGQHDLPAVFCSRHGESRAYFGMLEDLAAHRELSPSGFSLSVHNAIAGLYSQFSGNRSALCVLAPGREGPFAAFMEAAGLLLEGHSRVLVVCYEQPLPEAYRAYTHGPGATLALALRAGTDSGPRLRIARKPADRREPIESCALETFTGALLTGQRQGNVAAGPARWEWSLEGV